MNLGEAILYGAVQGITEYLPVSSSAHLILLPRFLGTEDPGLAFDVFLHLGTLLATLVYFWREWRDIFLLRSRGILQAIVLGTLPALVVGALLHHAIEEHLRSPMVMVWSLSLGGIVLFAADRLSKRGRTVASIGFRDALFVGVFQCLALIPGVSRSGSTITAGRLVGLERGDAARFSFLLSAPVTAAAILFELRHFRELAGSLGADGTGGGGALVAGLFSSFFFGCLAISGLLKLLRRYGYLIFALYRICLAIVIVRFLT